MTVLLTKPAQGLLQIPWSILVRCMPIGAEREYRAHILARACFFSHVSTFPNSPRQQKRIRSISSALVVPAAVNQRRQPAAITWI